MFFTCHHRQILGHKFIQKFVGREFIKFKRFDNKEHFKPFLNMMLILPYDGHNKVEIDAYEMSSLVKLSTI